MRGAADTRRGVAALFALSLGFVAVLALLDGFGSSEPTPGAPYTYHVQPGDTLWSVANCIDQQVDTRITLIELSKSNDVGGELRSGELLKVPASVAGGKVCATAWTTPGDG